MRAVYGGYKLCLYYADVVSDVAVVLLLFESGALVAGSIAAALLVAQYVLIYLRVLAYLEAEVGRRPWHYLTLLLLPLADFAMLLEPFGLMVLLPQRLREHRLSRTPRPPDEVQTTRPPMSFKSRPRPP